MITTLAIGADTRRFEVHGFIPGRGFLVKFYEADSEREAVEIFKRDTRGMAFWVAPASGRAIEIRGASLGLHTPEERTDAARMANRAYFDALDLLGKGDLRGATERLGYLQAVAALAYSEGEEPLGQEVDDFLLQLGPQLEEAWRTAGNYRGS